MAHTGNSTCLASGNRPNWISRASSSSLCILSCSTNSAAIRALWIAKAAADANASSKCWSRASNKPDSFFLLINSSAPIHCSCTNNGVHKIDLVTKPDFSSTDLAKSLSLLTSLIIWHVLVCTDLPTIPWSDFNLIPLISTGPAQSMQTSSVSLFSNRKIDAASASK